jgi:hypothetical protein
VEFPGLKQFTGFKHPPRFAEVFDIAFENARMLLNPVTPHFPRFVIGANATLVVPLASRRSCDG